MFCFGNSVAFWILKKFHKNAILHYKSGNFHEVLPDILVFLKIYSNVPTET